MNRNDVDKAILADIKEYIEEHLVLPENVIEASEAVKCSFAAPCGAAVHAPYDAEMVPQLQTVKEDAADYSPAAAAWPKPQAQNEANASAKRRSHLLSLHHAPKAKAASYEVNDAYPDADQSMPLQSEGMMPRKDELRNVLSKMGTTFARALQEEIDKRKLKDSQVYRKAQMSRAAYSKIITGQATPKKTSAVALLLALELDTARASELLSKAGLFLADNNEFDLIVRYCFEHAIYDIDSINDILYEFDQPLLGSSGK